MQKFYNTDMNMQEDYYRWDKVEKTILHIGNLRNLQEYLYYRNIHAYELSFSFDEPRNISPCDDCELWSNRFMYFVGSETADRWTVKRIIDPRLIEPRKSDVKPRYVSKSRNNHTARWHRGWYSKIEHVGALARMIRHPDYIKYNRKKANKAIGSYSWEPFRPHHPGRCWKDNKNCAQWEKHMIRHDVLHYDKREAAYLMNECSEEDFLDYDVV